MEGITAQLPMHYGYTAVDNKLQFITLIITQYVAKFQLGLG